MAGDGRGEPGLLAKYSCSWKRLLSFGNARTVGSSESRESICLFRLLSIKKGVVSKAVSECWCVEVNKQRSQPWREFGQSVEIGMTTTTTLLLLRHFFWCIFRTRREGEHLLFDFKVDHSFFPCGHVDRGQVTLCCILRSTLVMGELS